MRLSNDIGANINVTLELKVLPDSTPDEVVGIMPYKDKIVIVTRSGKLLLVENDSQTDMRIACATEEIFGEVIRDLEGNPLVTQPNVEPKIQTSIRDSIRSFVADEISRMTRTITENVYREIQYHIIDNVIGEVGKRFGLSSSPKPTSAPPPSSPSYEDFRPPSLPLKQRYGKSPTIVEYKPCGITPHTTIEYDAYMMAYKCTAPELNKTLYIDASEVERNLSPGSDVYKYLADIFKNQINRELEKALNPPERLTLIKSVAERHFYKDIDKW